MDVVRPLIVTERLELVAPQPAMADAVLDFFDRNHEHLVRWDPPTPPRFYTVDFHRERLEAGATAFKLGSAWRWWLRLRGQPRRVIGNMHFSQVVRGVLQATMLGYSLDAECEGHGLMREALDAGIGEVFSPAANLHRIQANVRPENTRSLALLQRLGFEQEGVAREYLYIDGAWRDHVVHALHNTQFSGVPTS